MDVIERFAKNFTLSNKNAGNEPEWNDKSRAIWEPADEDWQAFNAKWYGATESQFASLVDPESPALSLEPLPPGLDPDISSLIVVRTSYVRMFDIVWEKAISSKGRRGVIITGQPGTGKTLFNYYLLVRLLQRKQVILFSPDDDTVFLFYQNEVYTASMAALSAYVLPRPIQFSSNVFIWSLFDIRELREPRKFLVCYPCLPVQTTSPNPTRYKTWKKERKPLLASLPLWTSDELTQGLKYQAEYGSLLDALYEVYSSSPSPDDPLDVYPGARKHLEEHYSEEDTVQPSPEDALEYLLDIAIEHFGYSARDVFGAVFNYPEVNRSYENAFRIRYTDLQDAVSALSTNQVANQTVSHRILALSPIDTGALIDVKWDVYFKSDWVARSVIQKLGDQEGEVICQKISFYRNIEANTLAGKMLEPFAHRYIANAKGGGKWPLIKMNPNDASSPKFTLVQNSPIPIDVRFTKVKRKIVKFKGITDLSTGLENNTYYILLDTNFPLFDSFTVELDCAKKSAILWVLQMTASRRQGGSSRGYQRIREIIAIMKDQLGEDHESKKIKTAAGPAIPRPFVQVYYLLVVPKDEPQSHDLEWQFPKGWNQNWKRHDHRGKVYCLEVPLTLLETGQKLRSSPRHKEADNEEDHNM